MMREHNWEARRARRGWFPFFRRDVIEASISMCNTAEPQGDGMVRLTKLLLEKDRRLDAAEKELQGYRNKHYATLEERIVVVPLHCPTEYGSTAAPKIRHVCQVLDADKDGDWSWREVGVFDTEDEAVKHGARLLRGHKEFDKDGNELVEKEAA